ncbi:hypothetical protein Hena1_00910 [Erwinia phage Hena1]|uniref:Uncharacterized protein n=1 Tax=Erwinia phage Hena1 TaxID=2678601 RepID=A0A6B9JI92_9CAUD|nr:hypothetical protein HWC84_gp090 [Erwinia phage Hena1]QGZ16267.1 hypothetical protein Hena1_00910 [Erwinia phage Hena1]
MLLTAYLLFTLAFISALGVILVCKIFKIIA